MDHRRTVTCCWAWAVCIVWIAAADQTELIPTPKDSTGVAESPSSPTVLHSTADTISASRAFDNASGAPAYSAAESASLPAHVSIASTVSAQVPTPPPRQVMPSEAPLTPTSSSPVPSSPVATTMSQLPARPSPTQATTHREEITKPYYAPPATPSRRSTLLTPTSSSNSTPLTVHVEPAEEKTHGEPAAETKTAPVPTCDYDPCVHLQRSCPELQRLQGWTCGCSARGPADPSATPGPVVALEVTRARPTSAAVRWCAPDSGASAFLVWVLRSDGSAVSNGSVSPRARRTDVLGLAAGGHVYSVCVRAQSAAGALSHRRCVPVVTLVDAEAIAVYVLAGSCGVLLLAVAALSLCLCRQCERRRGSAEHSFQDPRLACSMVSIANPAYAPADQQAAPASAHRAAGKKSTNER